MGCCFGIDLSGSILTFSPSQLKKEKGSVTNRYGGCLSMSLYQNRISYDGFPCCSICCLCECCRGIIAFNHIHSLEVNNDEKTRKKIYIIMRDGTKFEFGPLSSREAEIIQKTYSESNSFLP